MRQKATNKNTIGKAGESNRFWDQEVAIGEVPYGDAAKHVFSVCVKDNKKYITMSRMYRSKRANTWILTNKGTTLRYEEFPDIFDKLQESFQKAKDLEIEISSISENS